MNVLDNLETRVIDLFEAQALALDVPPRAWDDTPTASVATLRPPRRSRPLFVAVVATAASAVLIVGAVTVRSQDNDTPSRVTARPSPGTAVAWETPQVSLTASDFAIVADGETYTSAAAKVTVHSDPGDATYQTLELEWRERNTEMRWYIYFTADATQWWSNEMRTYNGHGEWITYTGDFFRSPRGTAYTGDLDLSAIDSGIAGRLRVHGLRLEAFKRLAVCEPPTPGVVLDVLTQLSGYAYAVVHIRDRMSCEPVANPRAYRVDWVSDNPAVARITTEQLCAAIPRIGVPPEDLAANCANGSRVGLERHPGSTTLHLSLVEVATGDVVATAEVAVTGAPRHPTSP